MTSMEISCLRSWQKCNGLPVKYLLFVVTSSRMCSCHIKLRRDETLDLYLPETQVMVVDMSHG